MCANVQFVLKTVDENTVVQVFPGIEGMEVTAAGFDGKRGLKPDPFRLNQNWALNSCFDVYSTGLAVKTEQGWAFVARDGRRSTRLARRADRNNDNQHCPCHWRLRMEWLPR